MTSFRLYKKDKLCSAVAISRLFGHDASAFSALAYPLRAVWADRGTRRGDAPLQFLISVPKKKLRHAVDRVKMRRRIREAFRLHRHEYALPEGTRADIVFVYLASDLVDYGKVERAMCRLLEAVSKSFAEK